MKIETKYNIGDTVLFDGYRTGKIVGYEIVCCIIENGSEEPYHPECKDNILVKYQIRPTDGLGILYGPMRREDKIKRVKEAEL